MTGITIGQIASSLGLIAGIITAVGLILGVTSKIWGWLNNKEIQPIIKEMAEMETRITQKMDASDKCINDRIDNLNKDLTALDVGQCKNYLVKYMADVEKGGQPDSSETERAFETMDRYTNVLHQNSYIHSRWEEVVLNKKNKH